MASQDNHDSQHHDEPVDVDPIWMSSRTARQIYALGEVEKVRLGIVLPRDMRWLTRARARAGHQPAAAARGVVHRTAHDPAARPAGRRGTARNSCTGAIVGPGSGFGFAFCKLSCLPSSTEYCDAGENGRPSLPVSLLPTSSSRVRGCGGG